MTPGDLHEAAVEAGATVLGDPPHYLMNADQLAAFLSHICDVERRCVSNLPPRLVTPPPY